MHFSRVRTIAENFLKIITFVAGNLLFWIVSSYFSISGDMHMQLKRNAKLLNNLYIYFINKNGLIKYL